MTTAHTSNGTTPSVSLHLAFELGWTHWKLAFTIGQGQKARQRSVRARELAALEQEIAKAKKRFKLVEDVPVVSCYEAGRDGFWFHRYLAARGIAAGWELHPLKKGAFARRTTSSFGATQGHWLLASAELS
jgi:transposase